MGWSHKEVGAAALRNLLKEDEAASRLVYHISTLWALKNAIEHDGNVKHGVVLGNTIGTLKDLGLW